jgi:cell division protein FtsZ
VVTKPFKFEGNPRMKRALEGIDELKTQVDSLIIIPNERLKSLGDKTTPFKDLFVKADDVLLQAVKGIADLIMSRGFVNLDFADVKKVMEQMGTALMGMGRASGPPDMTMDEVDAASNYIKNEVNENAEVFWGMVLDDTLKDEVQITVIATGIDGHDTPSERSYLRAVVKEAAKNPAPEYDNVVRLRDVTAEDIEESWTVRKNGVNLDTPTFLREKKFTPESPKEEPYHQEKKSFFDKFRFRENLDYPTFMRAKAD